MCLNDEDRMANSVDPGETESDLGLYYLLRSACLKI